MKATAFVLSTLLDLEGELYLIAGALILCVVPQILSYILSGIFGCASPPVFVATISRLAMLSLIKFLCVMSGITTAQIVFFTDRPASLSSEDPMGLAFLAMLSMTASFWGMMLYYDAETYDLSATTKFKWLAKVLRYMSKYQKSNESEGGDGGHTSGLAVDPPALLPLSAEEHPPNGTSERRVVISIT
jgi:hypothetical protein